MDPCDLYSRYCTGRDVYGQWIWISIDIADINFKELTCYGVEYSEIFIIILLYFVIN